ncbi:TetR/AcrR family transcriptional regulator [Actinocrispum wychmicini]|uniref:TetR family transcriptional regulator n=1 Tax=Actinocrispum wychmicini TaxID=1213861 RepID=A0A4R2J9X9_9PSEU|nr:TetR/AcrR family transcriptional regulator [Actinocrispum wychmicini]TCO53438.1 TetR family transcriptional regulator [Actinocrispum wychmicini]
MVETVKPRRRQARGERRIAQLLDAAAHVFAAEGYVGATMNGVAAHAGVSPGTLYQFFPNKESMANALAEKYLDTLTAAQQQAAEVDVGAVPLDVVIDSMVDPAIEVCLANPGFEPLFSWSERLRLAVTTRVDALIAYRIPELDTSRRRLIATVTVRIIAAMLPVILAAAGRARVEMTLELKRVLRAYLLDISD